jgi:RNA polymerase-binding transcription factor DksA
MSRTNSTSRRRVAARRARYSACSEALERLCYDAARTRYLELAAWRCSRLLLLVLLRGVLLSVSAMHDAERTATPQDPQELSVLRRLLLAKGSEINEKLTRLLAGQTVDLGRLLGGGAPGETPAERLQRFLALIDERLHAIRDGRYGRCSHCGQPLTFVALKEVPWATTCAACSGAGLD